MSHCAWHLRVRIFILVKDIHEISVLLKILLISDKVVALYPYTASNPDELSFNKDDIISVTAREEEAWWRGELNGVSGLFPSNYVTPLQQQCK